MHTFLTVVRKFVKWLLVAIVAIAVLAAFFLIPAHRQIRDFDAPLPQNAEIFALRNAPDKPLNLSIVMSAEQPGAPSGTLAYPSFVLQWNDGRLFVIDVGMMPDEAVKFGEFLQTLTGADEIRVHGAIGDMIGGRLIDVHGTAVTHLHMDHVGGLPSLCKPDSSTIPLFQTADQAMHQNFTTKDGHEQIDNASCVKRETLQGDARLLPIPGFPGLAVYAAAGHTPGSSVFFAAVGDRIWVIAGDISNDRHSLLKNLPKPFPYSLLVTPEDPERLEMLRLWLAELDAERNIDVLLSHDFDALQQHEALIRPAEAGLISLD